MVGGIDILQSRRTMFYYCTYWKVDETGSYNEDELKYSKNPSGYFYASKSAPITESKKVVGGNFQIDRSLVTIKTKDVVDLKAGDKVKFSEEEWIVIDTQKKEVMKQSQFNKYPSKITYISLRK